MRSDARLFDLVRPASLPQALEYVARGWRPFAGGTDLMVLLEAGKLENRRFVSLRELADLSRIEVTAEHVTLGALVTYTQVRAHSVVSAEFPMLVSAAAQTGATATQNRGTIGGNIANASPAADTPPALLAYDAEIELLSDRGSRWLDYAQFHTGYKKTLMAAGEIISRIRMRRDKTAWRHFYRKVGTRRAQAISKVCLAAAAEIRGGTLAGVRIALGSVAPVPLRCRLTEDRLRGSRPGRLPEFPLEITPIDDVRSTARYRAEVARNLILEFLETLE